MDQLKLRKTWGKNSDDDKDSLARKATHIISIQIYRYKKSKRLNSWLALFWIGARFEDSNTGNAARKRNQVVSVEKSRIQREVKDQ